MTTPAVPAADRYALRAHPYGRSTGISLAVHAIADAFFLQHGGVGCKQKAANQIMHHDLTQPALHRQGWTELDERALVLGSALRLGPYIRSWREKRRMGLMVVSGVSFLDMTGEDFQGAVRAAADGVPFPVEYIRSRGFSGDLFQGYGEVVGRVLRRIPFRETPPRRGKVAVAGFVFDRYEPDVTADREELRRLVAELGLEPGPCLLGGYSFRELLQSADSERLLCLPYCRDVPASDLAAAGRPLVRTGLPVGLEGTERWLRKVASACQADVPVAEAAVQRGRGWVRPAMEAVRRRQSRRPGRSAVFAETPLAAALAVFLAELGLPPILVGLRDSSLGGAPAFWKEIAASGRELPSDLDVLENPSLEAVQRRIGRLAGKGRLGALLGSTYETAAAGPDPGFPCLEVGFPRATYHPKTSAPIYGFAGARNLCRRLLEAD